MTPDDIKKLIGLHTKRLQKLREQHALQGINTPVDIILEIEQIEKTIESLEIDLIGLDKPKPSSVRRKTNLSNLSRVAMPTWEIGRADSGTGSQIGGLGIIIETLPSELVKMAKKQDLNLEVEILTPCFGHHDKSLLKKLDLELPARIAGYPYYFDVFERIFLDGQKVIYFWHKSFLGRTNSGSIYPSDPDEALELYAALSQAMAAYIEMHDFDILHLQDRHVGLIPFYLSDDYVEKLSIVLTIHNATHQEIISALSQGNKLLDRINLQGEGLFNHYFEFNGKVNLMKAMLLKVHEAGGKISTVSGDLDGNWGYAAELRESRAVLEAKAISQKKGATPIEVFVPNCDLDIFERIPIAGITHGVSEENRPENLPQLSSQHFITAQGKRGNFNPIFKNSITQNQMQTRDHNFSVNSLDVKLKLKKLLHLEAFDEEQSPDTIIFTVIGRLELYKNLAILTDIIPRTLKHYSETKFIISASAYADDPQGKVVEKNLQELSAYNRKSICFRNYFDIFLSKLILAGGDFFLAPSHFDPCGLINYEAALLGNIVIGRFTGGLAKLRNSAYLYEWWDIGDRAGEVEVFFSEIKKAIETYRNDYDKHNRLIELAMTTDFGWERSAKDYIELYLQR